MIHRGASFLSGSFTNRDGERKQVVHRLRVVLTWAISHPPPQEYRNTILQSIEEGWPSVSKQRLQSHGRAYTFAVLWAHALDRQKSVTFVILPYCPTSFALLLFLLLRRLACSPEDDVIPTRPHRHLTSFVLMCAADGEYFRVFNPGFSPLKTLAGIHFFDAWRLDPLLAGELAVGAFVWEYPPVIRELG